MNRWGTWVRCLAPILLVVSGFTSSGVAQQPAAPPPSPKVSSERDVVSRFVNLYCVECHNSDDKTAGLALDTISTADVDRHPKVWEKVVRRLVARQMPPEGALR